MVGITMDSRSVEESSDGLVWVGRLDTGVAY
jgi:hypothetical protein